ncbi:MAG: Pup amidohydrolase [Pseudonocardiales bacterium]|jgi:proteasome accessory factor A|nr:Pup amidohydrolase [Pseudonocardiales bacterium]
MGTEVEYGVSLPGQPTANAMLLSAQIVNAYASMLPAGRARRASWDFEEESPLRDARGFDLGDGKVAQEFIEAEEDAGMANVILPNGARLYVDHAHPEYSSPEVTNPLDIVRWDKAGELVMLEAARRVVSMPGVSTPINLYKNNTDNKGASYGAHENYLCARSTPFTSLVRHLVPFFVTRQVICGAGRVGLGQDGRTAGFQISQRADFFEVEVGLETTLKRPIVNTRDEPHADADRYRRLHVIIGDANLAEIATYLKVGTTALVLAMIEDSFLADDLAIAQPVRELHEVSHDATLRHRVQLADGRTITALDLQGEYLDRARKFVDDRYGEDADEQTVDVLARWDSVLHRLADDPMQLADELDWVAKLRLLDGYRERDDLDWDSSRLQLVDLQYSDVRPEKGLYHRLVARGAMQTLLPAGAAEAAMNAAPEDTRAYFRGECLRRYGSSVAAASWDSVIFDVGRESLVRVPMLEPQRGTRAHVGELLDRCPTAASLIDALVGPR